MESVAPPTVPSPPSAEFQKAFSFFKSHTEEILATETTCSQSTPDEYVGLARLLELGTVDTLKPALEFVASQPYATRVASTHFMMSISQSLIERMILLAGDAAGRKKQVALDCLSIYMNGVMTQLDRDDLVTHSQRAAADAVKVLVTIVKHNSPGGSSGVKAVYAFTLKDVDAIVDRFVLENAKKLMSRTSNRKFQTHGCCLIKAFISHCSKLMRKRYALRVTNLLLEFLPKFLTGVDLTGVLLFEQFTPHEIIECGLRDNLWKALKKWFLKSRTWNVVNNGLLILLVLVKLHDQHYPPTDFKEFLELELFLLRHKKPQVRSNVEAFFGLLSGGAKKAKIGFKHSFATAEEAKSIIHTPLFETISLLEKAHTARPVDPYDSQKMSTEDEFFNPLTDLTDKLKQSEKKHKKHSPTSETGTSAPVNPLIDPFFSQSQGLANPFFFGTDKAPVQKPPPQQQQPQQLPFVLPTVDPLETLQPKRAKIETQLDLTSSGPSSFSYAPASHTFQNSHLLTPLTGTMTYSPSPSTVSTQDDMSTYSSLFSRFPATRQQLVSPLISPSPSLVARATTIPSVPLFSATGKDEEKAKTLPDLNAIFASPVPASRPAEVLPQKTNPVATSNPLFPLPTTSTISAASYSIPFYQQQFISQLTHQQKLEHLKQLKQLQARIEQEIQQEQATSPLNSDDPSSASVPSDVPSFPFPPFTQNS